MIYNTGLWRKKTENHIPVILITMNGRYLSHQDRDEAKLVLNKAKSCFCRLRLIWADGGYAGKLIDWVLEIVKRNDDVKGFQVLPRRWVVAHLAWLSFNRRLSKDYEVLPETSEAMVYVAMIRLMVRRLVTNIQPTGP